METLEFVQYSAALAVAWKGTLREKLYAELGWESLTFRVEQTPYIILQVHK